MKYDVAIIGGGPAGYTAAERAAQGGLSTILFEKNALGGVCLNEGCVPTKTLLYSAKTYDNIKHASKYAVKAENPSFDLPKIIARKNKVVKKLTAGIRMKMTEHGVVMVTAEACIQGRAADGTITIAAGEELYEAANLFDLYGIGNGNSSYTRIGGDGILDEPGGVAIEGASGLFGDNRWRRDRYGVRFFLQ